MVSRDSMRPLVVCDGHAWAYRPTNRPTRSSPLCAPLQELLDGIDASA